MSSSQAHRAVDAARPRLLHRRPLAPPRNVERHRRHLFHPKTGWFRSFERRVSQLLSRHVYPHVPLLDHIYALQLQRFLEVAEADVVLPRLPAPFVGVRLLLASDLHAGPFLAPRALRLCLHRLCDELRPDLIVLAGDFFTAHPRELDLNREALAGLRAPLGVFAVLGNHDHYTGHPDRVRGLLEELGMKVLHNRCTTLVRGTDRITLAGVDDMNSGEPDLDRALAHATPPVVLISHNPDFFFDAVDRGVDLVLSGHTHGGQVRIPGLPVLVRQSRYRLDEGRYRLDGTELVVSRGLGVTGIPLRVGCPPEAILLRLSDGRAP